MRRQPALPHISCRHKGVMRKKPRSWKVENHCQTPSVHVACQVHGRAIALANAVAGQNQGACDVSCMAGQCPCHCNGATKPRVPCDVVQAGPSFQMVFFINPAPNPPPPPSPPPPPPSPPPPPYGYVPIVNFTTWFTALAAVNATPTFITRQAVALPSCGLLSGIQMHMMNNT